MHGFFHKYAEIPDPNFPEILNISVDIDETLANGLIRKRRTLRSKMRKICRMSCEKCCLRIPCSLRENCIIDMKNKTLEMCTHNKSFSNLGQMLDFNI